MNKSQSTHNIIAVDISKDRHVTYWGGELLDLPYTSQACGGSSSTPACWTVH